MGEKHGLKFLRSVFFLMPKEKEDKASLQAEVQHLREDNLRLQEESQNATEKLKKFTEWVFNTIDMNWEQCTEKEMICYIIPGT